jgi:hypothetical protein
MQMNNPNEYAMHNHAPHNHRSGGIGVKIAPTSTNGTRPGSKNVLRTGFMHFSGRIMHAAMQAVA